MHSQDAAGVKTTQPILNLVSTVLAFCQFFINVRRAREPSLDLAIHPCGAVQCSLVQVEMSNQKTEFSNKDLFSTSWI